MTRGGGPMRQKVCKMMTKISISIFALYTLGIPFLAVAETIDQGSQPINTPNSNSQSTELAEVKDTQSLAPAFSFEQAVIKGTEKTVTSLSFISTEEVDNVAIKLPSTAEIIEDELSSGMSSSYDETFDQWLLSSETPKKEFTVPVMFAEAGTYSVTVGETATVKVEITKAEPNHSSEEEKSENNEQKEERNRSEEKQDEENIFQGETVPVSTRAEFLSALANPEVSTINLERSIDIGSVISPENLDIARSLKINGQMNTLNIGTGQMRLLTTTESKTLRIENTFLNKTDTNPFVIGQSTGENWTLQMEDVSRDRSSINYFRVADISSAVVRITGGELTIDNRINLPGALFTTKEFIVENQAVVKLGNTQNSALAFTRANAKLTVADGAELFITNSGTTALQNSVYFTESNATVSVKNNGNLQIQADGAASTSTDATSRNALSMTGNQSSIELENGRLNATTTGGQAIIMTGENPTIDVASGSQWQSQSNTAHSINLTGANGAFNIAKSTAVIQSTTGNSLVMSGNDATFEVSDASNVTINSSTGNRLTMTGITPTMTINDSDLKMTATTGAGIRLLNQEATLTVDNSAVAITNTGNRTEDINQLGTTTLGKNSTLRMQNGATLDVQGALVSTAGANSLIGLYGEESKATLSENAQLNLTVNSGTGNGIYLQGKKAGITFADSKADIQTVTGRAVELSGAEPSVHLDRSDLTTKSTSTGGAILLTGETSLFTLDNQSNMSVENEGGAIANVSLQGNQAKMVVDNQSQLSVAVPSTNSADTVITNNSIYLKGNAPTMEITRGASVDVLVRSGTKRGIRLDGANAVLSLNQGGKLTAETQAATAIQLNGDYVKLLAENKETSINAKSNYIATTVNGVSTVKLGEEETEKIGREPIVGASDSANITLWANSSSALVLQGINGQFNVNSKATLKLDSGPSGQLEANNANATLRFLRSGPNNTGTTHGGYQFNINGGDMTVTKRKGNAGGAAQMAPAIRMWGSNNQVTVSNAGRLLVVNEGTGIAHNGNTGGGNQGIHYTAGSNNGFSVNDPGSEVRIYANDGPALDMSDATVAGGNTAGGNGEIRVSNLGYFEASGRTASANAGIFRGRSTTVNFDNPLFMDYRNNRVGGGNIFSNIASSTLTATASDFAVWKDGTDLDADPYLHSNNMDYTFSGTNFSTLTSMEPAERFDFEAFGSAGLTSYSRLSSNNARWAIVNELRVPTNADKKIHGLIRMPVGLHDSRPAWQDEVKVTVEIERDGAVIQTYETLTHGHTAEKPGISIYDEEPQGGVFEIELDEYLQAGDLVRITDVEVLAGEMEGDFENVYEVEDVTVFPIIPPSPATFSNHLVPANARVISGHSDDPEVEVTTTHNGETIDPTLITIDDKGDIRIAVEKLNLAVDDVIQVFLRDHQGSASEAGVMNPPETNNHVGNINPKTPLAFRDATFVPATTLIVGGMVDGELTIDQASNWDFGTQPLTTKTQTYHALPSQIGGTEQETPRPNFVQVTDERPVSEISGWSLFIKQEEQFSNQKTGELKGAQLSWKNGQAISSTGEIGNEDNLGIISTSGILIPNNNSIQLIDANLFIEKQTWFYNFGDDSNKESSIFLNVPNTANAKATNYTTHINYSFQATPKNRIE